MWVINDIPFENQFSSPTVPKIRPKWVHKWTYGVICPVVCVKTLGYPLLFGPGFLVTFRGSTHFPTPKIQDQSMQHKHTKAVTQQHLFYPIRDGYSKSCVCIFGLHWITTAGCRCVHRPMIWIYTCMGVLITANNLGDCGTKRILLLLLLLRRRSYTMILITRRITNYISRGRGYKYK